MAINDLSNYEKETIESTKTIINNFDDYRQVEAIYNYCFDILNKSDYWNANEKNNEKNIL